MSIRHFKIFVLKRNNCLNISETLVLKVFFFLLIFHPKEGLCQQKAVQTASLHLSSKKLKGKIKTVNELTCRVKNNVMEHCQRNVQCFNEQGYETSSTYYANNDSVKTKHEHQYNHNNNLINTITVDSTGKKCTQKIYTYDAGNNLIRQQIYNHDTLSETCFFTYDSLNRCIKTLQETKNRKTECINTYDPQGHSISQIYSGDFNAIFTHHYINNNLVSETSRLLQLTTTHTYTYNKSGQQIIDETVYDTGGTLQKSLKQFRYDEKGNVAETAYLEFGTVTGKTTYKYRYDKNQNWTEKKLFLNGKLKTVIKREITYY